MRAGAGTALFLLLAQSCGFPDHTFNDELFYGSTKDAGAAGGSSLSGASGIDGSATGGKSNGGEGGQGGRAGGGAVGGGGVAGEGVDASTGGAGGNGGVGGIGAGGLVQDGAIHGKEEAGTGTGGTGTGGTGGTDAGPPDAGLQCAPGLDPCSGVCVDLAGDKNHCGDCVTKCTGTDVCNAGTCKSPCDPGLTVCKGTCVDTNTDKNFCGNCNVACTNLQICESGTCVKDCGTETRCGTNCYDTQTDDLHCGNCVTDCTLSNKHCSGGICRLTCSTPFSLCNNACVDFSNDDANCGGCGAGFACTQQQACVGGLCKNLVEDCQNGSDDDRDGKVDCEDADCGAYTCAATPSGWQGPVALWTGGVGAAPGCPGTWSTDFLDAHKDLVAPASSCPDCQCTPSGASCGNMARMWFDNTTTCTAALGYAYTIPSNGSCVSAFMGDHVQSLQFIQQSGQPPIASGSCVGTTPTPQFPAASWLNDVRACGGPATTGAGCALGQCVPKPAAPYGAKLCVFRAGLSTCPTGYTNQQPTYYQTWQEGRSCSACNCGQVTCGGSLKLYSDSGCSVGGTDIPFDGSCNQISPDPTPGTGKSDTRSLAWTNAAPQCGTSPSNLLGAPQPNDPVTICCQ